jgi:gliding motility-associated-like protein
MRELITKALVNNNHDGVILKNDTGSFNRNVTSYIAFYPEQIKSINNNGDFNPNEKSIMKEKELNEQLNKIKLMMGLNEALTDEVYHFTSLRTLHNIFKTNQFITTGETIQVFIQNSTSSACSFLTSIAFIVDSKPQANAIDVSLTTICDEEIDPLVQDGLFAFNTSGFETTILGGQTGVFVEFYDEDNVPLTNPLPNPFITSTQTITAKVINENNPNCFTTVAIPFKVLPTPKIVLQGNDQYVCLDNPSYLITLKAGFVNEIFIASHTYQWYLNQTPIQNATGYSVLINQSGTYTVEVTSVGGCTKTRTIQVIDSQRAIIENIVVNDLIDQNSIEIMVSGLGNYHYSIDGINYQESNVFSNVEPGIVTVFIKDLYNCGIVTAEVNVLAIPKFFTPNADSYNDVWNLKGVNLVYNVHSKIAIFDRYGKLIYQFIPINGGWNGTYNGRPLPSDDYWYLIQLEDGRTAKGHFTLKR